VKTIDISGFGGGYEAGCQKMLLNGLKFLNEHPNFDWNAYKEYRGVFGLTIAESSEAKELDDAVCQDVEPSGAMHSAVISHLAHINKHGYDGWIREAKKRGRTVYDQPSEEDLDKTILIARIEWQLKLDGGYNPLAELFKTVPMDNVITINPSNPDSIKKAAEEIARRMNKGGIKE